jgi:hypothetical protein
MAYSADHLLTTIGPDDLQECADALDRGYRAGYVRPAPEPLPDMRRKGPKVGTVYFIGPEQGPVKIGFTTNVPQRLARLQAGSPVALTVLAQIDGAQPFDERLLHMEYRAHRLHGEWFERCPEIEAEIERLAAI